MTKESIPLKGNRTVILWLVPALILAFFLTFQYWYLQQYPIVNRSNWGSVNEVFIKALFKNNNKVAKSLAIPEQWEQIDNWMANREPFSCPFSWEIDNEPAYLIGGGRDEDGIVNPSYVYQCLEEQYSFHADLVLQKTEMGWQVIKLVDVCEKRGWNNTSCR
jgi:hypothetical protein